MSVKVRRIKRIFVLAAALVLFFNSCNVTRRVITQSEYSHDGDKSVVIVTKTTESYDASKKIYKL